MDGSSRAGGSAAIPEPQGSPAADSSAARVRIQVASYASEANASGTLERLRLSGLYAVIERSGARFRVVLPDLSLDESRVASQRLDGLGYRGYSVTTITPVAKP